MWFRSGLYVGRAVADNEAKLVDGINGELIAAMRRLPGVANAMVLWPRSSDEGDDSIFCQILFQFDNKEDMEKMMNSPERENVRPIRDRLLPLFDGKVIHIDYEVS